MTVQNHAKLHRDALFSDAGEPEQILGQIYSAFESVPQKVMLSGWPSSQCITGEKYIQKPQLEKFSTQTTNEIITQKLFELLLLSDQGTEHQALPLQLTAYDSFNEILK